MLQGFPATALACWRGLYLFASAALVCTWEMLCFAVPLGCPLNSACAALAQRAHCYSLIFFYLTPV